MSIRRVGFLFYFFRLRRRYIEEFKFHMRYNVIYICYGKLCKTCKLRNLSVFVIHIIKMEIFDICRLITIFTKQIGKCCV